MSWFYQPLTGAVLLLGGEPPAGVVVKVWSGTAWVAKSVKYWTGAAWVEKPVKTWSGVEWV